MARIRASKAAHTLELSLAQGYVLVVLGLERLMLGHLLSQCLLMVHHGLSYPHESILIPQLHFGRCVFMISRYDLKECVKSC